MGFPGDSVVKNLPANAGASGNFRFPLGQKDSLGEEMATHSSILAWKNPMDRGAWQATVQRVTKSQTWLNDWAHAHICFFTSECFLSWIHRLHTHTHTHNTDSTCMHCRCPQSLSRHTQMSSPNTHVHTHTHTQALGTWRTDWSNWSSEWMKTQGWADV